MESHLIPILLMKKTAIDGTVNADLDVQELLLAFPKIFDMILRFRYRPKTPVFLL